MKISEYPKRQRAHVTMRHGRKDISRFMASCDLIPKDCYITQEEEIILTFTALKKINPHKFIKNVQLAYESVGNYVASVRLDRIEDI